MRRVGTIVSLLSAAVILAVLGGYAAYWFVIAGQIEAGVERWEAERRAEGWTVARGPIARGGFPFALELAMPEPSLARGGGDPLAWRAERLTAALQPWAPRDVALRFPGRHDLTLPAAGKPLAVALTLGAGGLDLRFDGRGRAEAAALAAGDIEARLAATGEQLAARSLRVVYRRPPPAPPPPPGQAALALETDSRIEDLRLPPRLAGLMGNEVQLVALLANLIGPLPQGTTAAAMAAWRDAGGYVEVREFQLRYGRLQIQAAGTARLDAQLQPVVQLDGKVRGGEALVDALVADRQLSLPEGILAKAALLALMRPDEQGGPPYLRLAITVRDGNRIYLGPVRVGRLPPLQWR